MCVEDSELLPCPFCGGAVEITQKSSNAMAINCYPCELKFEREWGLTRRDGTVDWRMENIKKDIIEKWNTRHTVEGECCD